MFEGTTRSQVGPTSEGLNPLPEKHAQPAGLLHRRCLAQLGLESQARGTGGYCDQGLQTTAASKWAPALHTLLHRLDTSVAHPLPALPSSPASPSGDDAAVPPPQQQQRGQQTSCPEAIARHSISAQEAKGFGFASAPPRALDRHPLITCSGLRLRAPSSGNGRQNQYPSAVDVHVQHTITRRAT